MAIQDPAAAETTDGEHLFDGMGKGMAQHKIVTELFADLPRRRVVRLVKAERYAKILERGPKRLVVWLVPVIAVDNVGAQKNRAEAQRLDAATRLGDRVVDVER